MKPAARPNLARILAIPLTAILYGALMFFVQSHQWWISQAAKTIFGVFPASMKERVTYRNVTITTEVLVFLFSGFACAVFMRCAFRSGSWLFGLIDGLIAASLAIGTLIYIFGEWLPYQITLGVISLPLGCVLAGRIWRVTPLQPSESLAPS